MPFKVVNIDAAVVVRVACQLKYLALDARLVNIKYRALRFKERGLVVLLFLALHGIAGADEALQSQPLNVLRKKAGEVAPFGVVARQKNHLVAKRVGIVLQIGVYLLLNVGILRVELIVLRRLCICKIRICHND